MAPAGGTCCDGPGWTGEPVPDHSTGRIGFAARLGLFLAERAQGLECAGLLVRSQLARDGVAPAPGAGAALPGLGTTISPTVATAQVDGGDGGERAA